MGLRRGTPAYRTWCFTLRKTLFLRRQAPRLWRPRRCRRAGRGAPPPASPCSFVVKHHVFGAQGAAGVPDVVPHSPQAIVLSSSSTTPLAPRRCRRAGRGAPLPAKPCSFVVEHHVFGAQDAAGVPDVVPHSPQSLVLSSSSTTSLRSKAPDGPTAGLASKK